MTQQNKILELSREGLKKWNDSRTKNEAAAIDKFWKLKTLFDAQKKVKPVNQ